MLSAATDKSAAIVVPSLLSESVCSIRPANSGRRGEGPLQADEIKGARVLRWFYKNWHELAVLSSAILGLLSAVVPHWFIVIPAIALFVSGAIRQFTRKPTYTGLLDKVSSLESADEDRQAVFSGLLGVVLKDLSDSLGLWNENTRVSAYSHNGHAFVMVGRQSFNPSHARSGRALYPVDEGLIGRAWELGHAEHLRLPATTTSRAELCERVFAMDKAVALALKMQSICIVAVRLDDPASGEPVGVLVAESTTRSMSKNFWQTLGSAPAFQLLQALVSSSKDVLPDVSGARRRGF